MTLTACGPMLSVCNVIYCKWRNEINQTTHHVLNWCPYRGSNGRTENLTTRLRLASSITSGAILHSPIRLHGAQRDFTLYFAVLDNTVRRCSSLARAVLMCGFSCSTCQLARIQRFGSRNTGQQQSSNAITTPPLPFRVPYFWNTSEAGFQMPSGCLSRCVKDPELSCLLLTAVSACGPQAEWVLVFGKVMVYTP